MHAASQLCARMRSISPSPVRSCPYQSTISWAWDSGNRAATWRLTVCLDRPSDNSWCRSASSRSFSWSTTLPSCGNWSSNRSLTCSSTCAVSRTSSLAWVWACWQNVHPRFHSTSSAHMATSMRPNPMFARCSCPSRTRGSQLPLSTTACSSPSRSCASCSPPSRAMRSVRFWLSPSAFFSNPSSSSWSSSSCFSSCSLSRRRLDAGCGNSAGNSWSG